LILERKTPPAPYRGQYCDRGIPLPTGQQGIV